jgi:hypothetical protein
MRRVVREALHKGWAWGGWTGTTHARLLWPPTGEAVTFGCTPSLASWKSLATDIQRVSGVTVWRKGNRKRSRKAYKPSGFSVAIAAHETATWHGLHDKDVQALHAERVDLITQCQQRAQHRDQLRGIPPLLERIAAIEQRLVSLHQHVEPFDPFTLAKGA